MKKRTLLVAAILSATTTVSMADNSFFDKARVIHSKPLYETVRVNHPEERCWNERVRHRGESRSDSYTPSIAGAIVGGVVGNQFGKGKGKDAMTVAGALLGASVGNDLGKTPGRSYVTSERRCETVDNFSEHEELVGYRVKYKYNGQVFHTSTRHDPGKFINVRVSVAPTGGSDYDYRQYD
ncbi:MAG: glycine zipper 2TM domain-containing protein [Sedimenticola sp.]|nr:glycine zipper 2TM domain-containing protein [Sedimenticola sp.]